MEKKIAHLEMIQGVINRLASNSFQVKGWSVLLVSALFALGAKDAQPTLVYIAFLPAVIFWALDGYFLWQGRLFRGLFDRARDVDDNAVNFSMDLQANVQDAPTWAAAVFSKTLILFHGVIVSAVVGAAILLTRRCS
jgi:hypothetical protein